jgi:hypothetical protein
MVKPPDPVLLSYLASYDPNVAGLALAMREVVLEEAPEAVESFFKGYAVTIGFSLTNKPLKNGFCHIVTYSTYVNLGFNRGALLPDPKRGVGRHWQDDSPHYFPERERRKPSVCPSISPGSHRAGKPTSARRARYAQGRNEPQTAFKTTLTTP